MELAEVLADIAADITSRTELLVKLASGTELEARVEIWQLKELEVFNALRLSIEVFVEVLPEVLTDVAVEVLVEIFVAEILC